MCQVRSGLGAYRNERELTYVAAVALDSEPRVALEIKSNGIDMSNVELTLYSLQHDVIFHLDAASCATSGKSHHVLPSSLHWSRTERFMQTSFLLVMPYCWAMSGLVQP